MFKKTNNDRFIAGMNYLFLSTISITMLVPFVSVFVTSIATETEVLKRGSILFPKEGFSLDTYKFLFKFGSQIPRSYIITILITVIGTILSLLTTAMLSYSITKRTLPGRKWFVFLLLFSMFFQGGLIPTYMVVNSLGMIDKIWSMIFPAMISVWNLIVMKSFFEALPESIEESVKIDGGNDLIIFFFIVVPLSIPIIATISLFYAVQYWNEWFAAVIYINRKELWPLQLLLRQILTWTQASVLGDKIRDMKMDPPPNTSIKNAMIVVAVFPILVTYPYLQKYFVKGIMIGAIKG